MALPPVTCIVLDVLTSSRDEFWHTRLPCEIVTLLDAWTLVTAVSSIIKLPPEIETRDRVEMLLVDCDRIATVPLMIEIDD